MENYFLRRNRRTINFIFLICVLGLLLSCSNLSENITHITPSNISESTVCIESSQDTNSSDFGYVYTYETRMNLDDVVISIPHINISPEIDAVVNGYIDSRFTKYIDKYTSINYESTINASLLSLLIYAHEGYSFGGGSTIYTVTVDLKTGKIITLPEILEQYGFDYFETTRKYNFTTALPEEAQQVTESPKADFAILNFESEQFFITSDNHICLVGTLYRGTILDDPNTSRCVDPLYKFNVLWDMNTDQIIRTY